MWHNVRLLNGAASVLLAFFVVVVLMTAVDWFTDKPMFVLRTVEVKSMNGDALRHISSATVRANVGRFRGNFFSVDLDGVRAEFETVPWVRRASVRRRWPNGLEVLIEEHAAMGTWGRQESARLVNTYGEVFVANVAEAEDDAHLMAFGGPEGTSSEVIERMEAMAVWFAPLDVLPEEVVLSDRFAWSARFSNGMKVEFGREQTEHDRQALEARVQRFVAAWPKVVGKWGKQIESVDLRYPNGFAIRPAGMRFLNETAAVGSATH